MSSDNKEEWYSTIQAEPTPESVKGEIAKTKLQQLGYVWCESKSKYVNSMSERLIDGVNPEMYNLLSELNDWFKSEFIFGGEGNSDIEKLLAKARGE